MTETELWCVCVCVCVCEQQVGAKVSQLVTSYLGEGIFIMVPLNSQHAKLLIIGDAQKTSRGYFLRGPFLLLLPWRHVIKKKY